MDQPARFMPAPQDALRVPPLPSPELAQVWLDFDGTLTRTDVLDMLIARFARNESWRLIEERWRTGQIGSRRCLEEEFELLDLSRTELAAALSGVELDPGAASLLALLRACRVPFAVLSDGIDVFIDEVFRSAGLDRPTVRANAVVHRGRRLALRCPHAAESCESGAAHCKCASAAALGKPKRRSIYVGDGRSDLCAARRADHVFAKGVLAELLEREGREFTLFSGLGDVHAALARAWKPAPGEPAPRDEGRA